MSFIALMRVVQGCVKGSMTRPPGVNLVFCRTGQNANESWLRTGTTREAHAPWAILPVACEAKVSMA
jgi:hypothetical protein